MLPFKLSVVLYFLQPIWASIIGFLFNKERLSYFQIFSIFVAMFGVVVLTMPDVIFPWLRSPDYYE